MSRSLRNKHGCWTCRLRKKKCDEAQPVCAACSALSISCYGYGPKPDWMDHGDKEKEVANRIKREIKESAKRKDRPSVLVGSLEKSGDHARLRERGSADESMGFRIAPKPAEHQQTPLPGGHDASSRADHHGPAPDLAFDPAPRSDISLPIPSVLHIKPEIESILLMHYLDTVFPMQYPVYKPGLVNGGRGWLLSLLLRTKTFYHVTLALSAHHRKEFFLLEGNTIDLAPQEECIALFRLDFQQAVKDVEQSIMEGGPDEVASTIASLLQLFWLELLSCHEVMWKRYLSAALSLFHKHYPDRFTPSGEAQPFSKSLSTADPTSHTQPISEETTIFHFLSAVLLHLDIISSVTLGISSRLIRLHASILSPTSPNHISLAHITGCENWAFLHLARVSDLHALKSSSSSPSASHPTSDFIAQSNTIKKDLRHQLALQFLTCISIKTCSASPPSSVRAINYISHLVTRAYGLAAYILLHLTTHGFSFQAEDDELHSVVRETMGLLRVLFPAKELHTIVCPLFIIGVGVRSAEDKEFLRKILSERPVRDPLMVHRNGLLPLLEEVWRKKDGEGVNGGWSWEDCLRLANGSLLLL